VGVALFVGVDDAVGVAVGLGRGVLVVVGVAVGVCVGVDVFEGVDVIVTVAVNVGVEVGVEVLVGVAVCTAVAVAVALGVAVRVGVAVTVGVAVLVSVVVAVGVAVAVGVGVRVGPVATKHTRTDTLVVRTSSPAPTWWRTPACKPSMSAHVQDRFLAGLTTKVVSASWYSVLVASGCPSKTCEFPFTFRRGVAKLPLPALVDRLRMRTVTEVTNPSWAPMSSRA